MLSLKSGLSQAFLVLLCCANAQADILFVDFNRAEQEIAAARRAADARGERLVVIPPPGQEKFTKETIRDTLIQMGREGKSLSSVIISGHDGNGQFAGDEKGRGVSMSADSLQKAFDLPEASMGVVRNVRSMLLWGCYTTNLGSLDNYWRGTSERPGAFPNMAVFAGFTGMGPNHTRAVNHTYLEDFLKLDKKILEVRDERELESLTKQIRGFNNTSAGIAICSGNGGLLANPNGVRRMEEMRQECQRVNPKLQQYAEIYKRYNEGRPGYEEPPANTSSSDLRTFYNLLQDRAHCRDLPGFVADNGELPMAEDVLNLIFYRNFRDNLRRNNSQDLKTMDKVLADAGVNLTVSDIADPRTSRGQMLERLRQIARALNGTNTLAGVVALGALNELTHTISTMRKAPHGWYEPGSNQRAMFLANSVAAGRAREYLIEQKVVQLESSPTYADITNQIQRKFESHPEYARYQNQYVVSQRGGNRAAMEEALDALYDMREPFLREQEQRVIQQLESDIQNPNSGVDVEAAREMIRRYREPY